ncbi:hypothetical protein SAMN05192562_101447 [Kosakonia arachidis]|uniref:Uncharacterized protein n=1 Tax=Kosakonia arachidis TaxID=551989 RepID=A0A1I6YCD9_9ENTR|nr:hypothetical protein [Kosakonia arachidis]SFT48062.1 hypothetical protein SAMN05192562_101447 [Kosakonia arachidis]
MSFHSFIHALPHWLDRQVTSGRLYLAIAVALLLQLAMMPLDQHLHAVSGGLGKPSLVFGSSTGELRQHLQAFGADGRSTLARLYIIDLFFPSALAVVAIQAGWLAFRRVLPGLALLLVGIAVSFDLLDLLEKVLSFSILARYPQIETGVLACTVAITTVKLICLAAIYTGLLASLVSWLITRNKEYAGISNRR